MLVSDHSRLLSTEDPEPTPPPNTPRTWSDVPWRTIIGTVLVVAATALVLTVIYLASRVVILAVIAGFFAVVLAPPVAAVQRKLHFPRALAVTVMVFLCMAFLVGMLALFLWPVRTQLVDVLTDLPGTVRQAAHGRGPVGNLVSKLGLEKLVEDNEQSLTNAAESMQESLPGMVGAAIEASIALITVVVMTALMLTQSSVLARTSTRVIPIRHRDLIVTMSRHAAGAVSGYMIGNLVISACAGTAAFAFLLIIGVPSPVVLALWVAFADLIPLVGATLGAVVAIVACLSVSPAAGIAAIIFFVLYQQFENSVLQVVVMSRTVKVNPIAVILSMLLGVELFGFIGALLAIPVAGVITVVAKELWRNRPQAPDELVVVSERGEESSV